MDGGSRYMFHRQGAAGNIAGPWFPDSTGGYCTKGVVETIRLAVLRSGGVARGSTGAWLVSGHTFRITAARTPGSGDNSTSWEVGQYGSLVILSRITPHWFC